MGGAVLTSLLVLAGCVSNIDIPGFGGRQTEEERVAAVLSDVHQAMQSRNSNRVISHLSEHYLDPDGRDYNAICVYVRYVHAAYRNIDIRRVEPRIEIEGGVARALEAFGTLASPDNPDEAAPVNLQGQVLVTLHEEDGKWKIVSWGTLR
jgi:hypothetical protein